jgi:predicted amidophosphoribosyltransferase
VPTTPTHQQQRGYNQAGELARELGKMLSLKVVQVLQRHETEFNSQTRLSVRQRLLNAYRSFSALPAYKSGKRPLPPSILLVDDVYTTGSTARACARALRHLPGVKAVAVLTFARALLD